MKRLMALMLLAMFSIGTLTACNTVKGVGKDVEKVGDKMQDKAAKSFMTIDLDVNAGVYFVTAKGASGNKLTKKFIVK